MLENIYTWYKKRRNARKILRLLKERKRRKEDPHTRLPLSLHLMGKSI